MNLALHANATTTPTIRALIPQSTLGTAALARELGVSVSTVRHWRHRDFQQDGSHTPHHLATTLTLVQEAVAVELRHKLELSLADLLAVVREFINARASRSGLDRCLRRHGVNRLDALRPAAQRQPVKTFKDYEPGFVHVDIKYMPQRPDESRRRYLFVAIDRATRWVYLAIRGDKTQRSACAFLKSCMPRRRSASPAC